MPVSSDSEFEWESTLDDVSSIAPSTAPGSPTPSITGGLPEVNAIPGYILKPTKSHKDWVVDRQLFRFGTTRSRLGGLSLEDSAFSATKDIVLAYKLLLELLCSDASQLLSPAALQLVSSAALQVFELATISCTSTPTSWEPAGMRHDFSQADLKSTWELEKFLNTNIPRWCQITSRLQRTRERLGSCRQEIHTIARSSLSANSRQILQQSQRLVDELFDLYDIMILAFQQIIAFSEACCSEPETRFAISEDRIKFIEGVLRAFSASFRPDLSVIAPLVNDSRWSGVRNSSGLYSSSATPPPSSDGNLGRVIVAGVIGGAVLTPLLGPAVLGVVGFSPIGPVAGSIAAGIQASIGNVVAGSAFAGAQAAAMGAGVPLIGQVIGGTVVATGTYITGRFRGRP